MVKRCCLLDAARLTYNGEGDSAIIELLDTGDDGRVGGYGDSGSK